MADQKITDFDTIPASADGDVLAVVDVSDTTDDVAGSSKKITHGNILAHGDGRTATLTNKSIDSDNNTITNLVNADIKAGAEIAVAKLADGAARQVLQTDAAGTGVEWTNDVNLPGTLDVTGAAVLDSTLSLAAQMTAQIAGLIALLQNTSDAISNQVLRLGGGNRGTPADNDEAYLSFELDDDLGAQTEFVRLTWKALDVTNDSKDSRPEFQYYTANTLRELAAPAITADDVIAVLALAQTLTNKTIDSDNNTITNLVNADIKSTAAIAFSKLAALTSAQMLVGNGSNVAVAVALTGDVLISNAGVTNIGIDVIVDADINSAAGITGTKVNIANASVRGAVELATAAETNTGTDATRAVTPDGLAGSDVLGGRGLQIPIFDDATAHTTGDKKNWFRVDQRLVGMNIVDVHAELHSAGTTGTLDIQLRNITQAADILSTKLTVDSGETGSDTAAVAAVIDTAQDDLQLNDVIAIDVDAIHTTPGNGLMITVGCLLP